jgi:hypothetical protein
MGGIMQRKMMVLLVTGIFLLAAAPLQACMFTPGLQPSFGEIIDDLNVDLFKIGAEKFSSDLEDLRTPAPLFWGLSLLPDYRLDWLLPWWVDDEAFEPFEPYFGFLFIPVRGWFLDWDTFQEAQTAVPIPGAAWLLSSGLVAFGVLGKRMRKKPHDR